VLLQDFLPAGYPANQKQVTRYLAGYLALAYQLYFLEKYQMNLLASSNNHNNFQTLCKTSFVPIK
jgi:hypothetical protein